MASTLLRWFAPCSTFDDRDAEPAVKDLQPSSLVKETDSGLIGNVASDEVAEDESVSLISPKLMEEVTLPIKRLWFERIAYGSKRIEFRDASPFWRGRLLGRSGLQRVRFLNGRSVDAPRMVCALNRIDTMAVCDIPSGLAPDSGTPAHRELFGNSTEVICLHLGDIIELHDPKKDSIGTKRAAAGDAAGGVSRKCKRGMA
mmetsp:Transcript_106698/g.166632  ORF Transcript_106698/g.166632 Transcript_106698/m.166632 type:complete len:201 (-) Transcript_106698:29-631(-)